MTVMFLAGIQRLLIYFIGFGVGGLIFPEICPMVIPEFTANEIFALLQDKKGIFFIQ